MENKDDLISRRAALDAIAKDIGMSGTYDIVESLPGQMTAAEAWEIVRKICCSYVDGGLHIKELQEVFGSFLSSDIMRDHTPEEAKTKIEAWENRLKVGDVVELVFGERKAIVIDISPNNTMCRVLFQDGSVVWCEVEHCKKTGKTIDIQSVLDQLGE